MSSRAFSARPLGVGMVYLPGLEALAERLGPDCDLFEVEPQAFWRNRPAESGRPHAAAYDIGADKLAALHALGKPILVHSVGSPVAGTNGLETSQIDGLRQTMAMLRPQWWSDHASFSSVGSGNARRGVGFLMPPLQSADSVALIVDHIKQLQDAIGLPFAFETGVNYFAPQPGELPDGEFWGAIADRAECGILLDLHNIWTNACNGRSSVLSVLNALPLERVWEIHLANGQEHKGYWLDSHSGLPPEALFEILEKALPRLPSLRAILFEIIPEYIDANAIPEEELRAMFARVKSLWRDHGEPAAPHWPSSRGSDEREERFLNAEGSPAGWEASICRGIERHRSGANPDCADPAFEIYYDLIHMARRGSIVDALPLTSRYLWLLYAEAGLEALFGEYFAITAPQPFMADEARSFASFVGAQCPDAPYLADVAAFEFAAQRAASSGECQTIAFGCDPGLLIAAIKSGETPRDIVPATIELEVRPPEQVAA